MANNNPNGLRETATTVLYAGLIALAIRTLLFEPFNIPSGSMIPTLLVGDYLFVSKYSYGYSKHSLPFSIPLFPGRVFSQDPQRGDVVVFKLPSDERTDYIKRIVGLPGDRIQVKGGILNINGEPVQRERIEDYVVRDENGNTTREKQYRETLPNGRSYNILEIGDNEPADNTGVYVVPPDHFFAMGNNRDNSRDSRFAGVSYIPRENLVGRAEFLFFSIDGAFLKFWEWPQSIRFERMFTKIR
jgi:signal peptidase I